MEALSRRQRGSVCIIMAKSPYLLLTHKYHKYFQRSLVRFPRHSIGSSESLRPGQACSFLFFHQSSFLLHLSLNPEHNAFSRVGASRPHGCRGPFRQQECSLRQGSWPDLQRQRIRKLLFEVQLLRIDLRVLRLRLPERLRYLLLVPCAPCTACIEEDLERWILWWKKGADLSWLHIWELLLAVWLLWKHVCVLWDGLQEGFWHLFGCSLFPSYINVYRPASTDVVSGLLSRRAFCIWEGFHECSVWVSLRS